MMKKVSFYFTVVSEKLHTLLASVEYVREEKMNEASAAELLADG